MNDIESGLHQEGKDTQESLESLPQSVAQVEQNQAALDQLHEEISDANKILTNSTDEKIAQDQIQRIKDNLRYLEENLIH